MIGLHLPANVFHVVVLPMLVAMGTALATLATRRFYRLQATLSVLGSLGYLGAVALLADAVIPGRILTYQLSNWPAPFGITLVADSLSAFMLLLAGIVSLAALAFSVNYVGEYGQRLSYHPLYHLMLVGVSGAFLTGDVFNLFVWFEVMLMSSYVLVVFYSGPEHTRAALNYLVLNLVGSAVMLLAIGGLYATTGTLNMADMARRLADSGQYGIAVAPVLGLSALLFTVFALKAGIVPFQFWVPAAYRAAPAPVSAMLAGVVKKVGVYAIIRLYFTIFAVAELPRGLALPGFSGTTFLAFYGPILVAMAIGSILVGGIGAAGRDDVDGLLAYSSIGQIGFIVLPLGIAATAPLGGDLQLLGIAAALVYAFNHGLAKGLLFLASGVVYDAVGSIRFRDLGGLAETTPVLAGSFLVGALALIGIPPLSGFFGKFLVFDAAGRAGSTVALAAALLGAILTIAYFTRAWNRGFWGPPGNLDPDLRAAPSLVGIVAALALVIVALGVGFDPLMGAANAAADAAVAHDRYVSAVLGGEHHL